MIFSIVYQVKSIRISKAKDICYHSKKKYSTFASIMVYFLCSIKVRVYKQLFVICIIKCLKKLDLLCESKN